MANIVDVPDMMVNAITVGGLSNQVLDYYQQSMTAIKNTVSSATTIGKNFLTFCDENFAKPAIDLFRRAQRKIVNDASLNVYHPILSVSELGTANDKMKGVVMSHPDMQKLHAKNRCDGYNNMFDRNCSMPGGLFDRINRAIMNNVLQEDKETDQMFQVSHMPDMYIDDMTELDRIAGLETYSTINQAIDAGIDPSAPDGARL